MKQVLLFISRVIVGIVFLFSGFVKAVDPLGYTYKITDYFLAFHLDSLTPLAMAIAIFFSTAELIIGFCLFTGIRMRFASWVVLIFMAFFTPLTLVLALTNPVTDCGCFGDAVILTNWQTFWKNIILDVFVVPVFLFRKDFKINYDGIAEWLLTGSFALITVLLSVYCYRELPVIDFRPYKVGTNISEGMKIPEGAEPDEYKTVLIYEKDGNQEEFTEENYPWQDTTWKWVETKSVLIKKGYEPPIHDFSLTSLDGYDITSDLLQYQGYTFLMVAYNFDKTNKEALIEANNLALMAYGRDMNFYCVTSSTDEEIETIKNEISPDFEIFTADEITLKTIVRANPGLLLIKDGNIIAKWHYNNFPSVEELTNKDLLAYSMDIQRKGKAKALVYSFILAFLFAVSFFSKVLRKEKRMEN